MLVFAASYALLRASWPWLEAPYSRVVHVEIAAAVSGMSAPLDIRRMELGNRRRLQGLDFDVEIQPARPLADRTRRRSDVWPVFVNSRRASYEPTALLLALIAATPVGLRRRARVLILAPIVLHILLLALLAAEVRFCLFVEQTGPMHPFQWAVVWLLSHAGAQSETHALLPALLWVAFFPDVVIGRRACGRLMGRAQSTANDE